MRAWSEVTMDDDIPTSVAEFLRNSRAFSSGVLLLEDEGDSSQPSEGGGCEQLNNGDDDDKRRQRRVVENAARVALLLTRSFADICRGSDVPHDAAHHHLSLIELDDFFVRLDKDASHAYGQLQPSAPKEESDDDLMDCFRQLVEEEEERQRSEVKDLHGKALGLGYFSSNNNSSNGTTGDEKLGGHSPPGVEARLKSSTDTDPTMILSHSGDEGTSKQVLYGMDIICPTRLKEDQQQSVATPMQILGKLLYGVFCLGESPPPDVSIAAAMEAPPEPSLLALLGLEGDFDAPSSRASRSAEASLFSQLVDSKAFPVAVCRLISDLIDTGLNADMPFRSFEGVVQELEQMISQPLICLHDSYPSHVAPRPPIFGQVYYGRDEEVARIVEIAERTKDCAPKENVGVEAVFVRGIAGSGKSQLVQTASDQLSGSGWTLIKAKFERGAEHASRGIVSSMFDEAVSLLAKMKNEGSQSDVASGERASKFILDYVGRDFLPPLADFLPSLPLLFGPIDGGESKQSLEDWQLVNCLSKVLEAVIEAGQHIILCADDIHWADRTSLSLITEVLTRLGETFCHTSRCCLFIGLYREDEVDDDHIFSIQYSYLQLSSNIRTSEISLTSLTKEDVTGMLMAELRLSRRMIWELSDTVLKKTSGHAFWIAELLNSLLRDSTIAYSPKLRRFVWDEDVVAMIQTGDNVAELIASNISTLSEEHQRILRILSSFGIQTDFPLLELLEKKFQGGIISSLDTFIERGILDRAGPILMFCHDLIQQAAYESLPLTERQELHLEIGRFLGNLASVDARSSIDPLTRSMGQLSLSDQIFFAGSNLTSSLVGVACDQIDSVPTEAISDDGQLLQFAEWNLAAGQKAAAHSDYRAATYYFSKGIDFLGKECWLNDYQLCLALHEGAVFASFSLAEADRVVKYAERVIKHVSFQDTLEIQQYLLKSLAQLGKHDECITRGTDILRKLGFDIPLLPTREIVAMAMESADIVYSKYSRDEILNLCERTIDGSARSIVRIMDAFYLACYASASPFLPLISCEIVKYSLKHGIIMESTVSIASYAMFKIACHDDYASGRQIAATVRAIIDKIQAANKNRKNFDIRAHLLLFITIDFWFSSPREVSKQLLKYHQSAKSTSQVDLAMIALQMGWRYKLYGGENLSLIYQGAEERTELIAKNSDYSSKYIVLDNALLEELTGKSVARFDDIDGFLNDVDEIQAEAEAVNHYRLLHHIHLNNLLLAFWRGDYLEAEKSSRAAWRFPTAMMPHILLIYHTFFGGLVAFRLFRSSKGDDDRLKEGEEMLDRMGKWAQTISMPLFGNKWRLLQAEHAASTHDHVKAKAQYRVSIELARDHGNIHELALAYELFGEFYSSHGCTTDANDCFKQSIAFYKQWGAVAVAERVSSRHNLDLADKSQVETKTLKRSSDRDW